MPHTCPYLGCMEMEFRDQPTLAKHLAKVHPPKPRLTSWSDDSWGMDVDRERDRNAEAAELRALYPHREALMRTPPPSEWGE